MHCLSAWYALSYSHLGGPASCVCMSSTPDASLLWPDSWLLLAGDHGTTAQGQAGKSAGGDATPGDDSKKAGGKGKGKAKGKAGAAKGKKGGKGKQQVCALHMGCASTVVLAPFCHPLQTPHLLACFFAAGRVCCAQPPAALALCSTCSLPGSLLMHTCCCHAPGGQPDRV